MREVVRVLAKIFRFPPTDANSSCRALDSRATQNHFARCVAADTITLERSTAAKAACPQYCSILEETMPGASFPNPDCALASKLVHPSSWQLWAAGGGREGGGGGDGAGDNGGNGGSDGGDGENSSQ